MIVFLCTFSAYFGITLHNFSFVWAKYWAIFKSFSPQPFSSLLRHPQTVNEYTFFVSSYLSSPLLFPIGKLSPNKEIPSTFFV